jgi:hypothetical protein
MFMVFAMAEFSGSKTITSPLKSSLKLDVLHFGHMLSFVKEWQLEQAFSLIAGHLSSVLTALSLLVCLLRLL